MNKKLDITAVEYQYKVRQQAKARTIKFRGVQEKRGYKNLTVYLSEKFRTELERLSTEKGLNRQAAMDYIFDIYQQNKTHCVTSNAMINSNKRVEAIANTGSESNRQTKQAKISKKLAQDGAIKERQTEILAPMPDRANKEAYRIWLYHCIKALNDSGMSWPAITEKLNSDGILSVSGRPFGSATARMFLNDNRGKIG